MKDFLYPLLGALKNNLEHFVHNTFGNTLTGFLGVTVAQLTAPDNILHYGGIIVLFLSILNLALQCATGFNNLRQQKKPKEKGERE